MRLGTEGIAFAHGARGGRLGDGAAMSRVDRLVPGIAAIDVTHEG